MKNIEIYCVTNKPIKFLETFNYQLCAVGESKFSEKYLLKNQGEMKIWYTVKSTHIPLKIEQKMKHGIMELVLLDYVIKK